jgi:hypothetical protein
MAQDSHQRAAELHEQAAHTHRVAAAHHGKQEHQTGQEHSKQAIEHFPRRHINSRWKRINNPLTLLPSTARRKTNLPSVTKTQVNIITL